MAVSDISVERMINLGVSPAKAVSAAVAASNTTRAAGFNQVVSDAGGTVTTSPTYPPAGTPISQSA